MATPDSGTNLDLDWRQLELATGPLHSLRRLGYTYFAAGVGTRGTSTGGVPGEKGPWTGLAIRSALARVRNSLHGAVRVMLVARPTAL